MEKVEIREGMTVEEILELLKALPKDAQFKHHIFKVRGEIELVFEN